MNDIEGAKRDLFNQETKGRLRYEPALDGIRAIAVFAVVIFHATPWLLPGGWAGVDVFFVLSGYLITRLLLEELSTSDVIDLKRFYIRRFLRLMPAFVLLLGAELILALFAHNKTDILEAVAMSATYLMNWNRAFDWLPQASLGHTWSLAMEEQFYILWPSILLVIWRRRPLAWIFPCITIILLWRTFLALHGADPERTYNGFDTHADALLIGCAVALTGIRIEIGKIAQKFVVVPLVAMAVILIVLHPRTILTQTIGLSFVAVISAWIMIAALQAGWLKRLLSIKPLTYTGRISYGWYLWHYPILEVGRPHLPHHFGIVLVAVSYLAAVASYHFIEKPALRLKARFEPSGERKRQQLEMLGDRSLKADFRDV